MNKILNVINSGISYTNLAGIGARASVWLLSLCIEIPTPASTAVGCTRFVKIPAIPFHIHSLYKTALRVLNPEKKEKAVDIAKGAILTGGLIEDLAVITLGFGVLKVAGPKVIMAANWASFVGVAVQTVCIAIDIFKIYQGFQHRSALDEHNTGNLHRFKDIYGVDKKTFNSKVRDETFYEHFKKRIAVNQFNRALNILISTVFLVAFALLMFAPTPIAPVAIALVASLVLISVAQIITMKIINNKFDKELSFIACK